MEPDRGKLTVESLKVGLSKLTGVSYIKIQLKGHGLEDGIERVEKELIKKYGSFYFRCANCKFDIPDLDYCPYCGAIFAEEKELTDKTVEEIEKGLQDLTEEQLKVEAELEQKFPFLSFIKRLLKGRKYTVKENDNIVFKNKKETKNIICLKPDGKIKFRHYIKLPGVKKIKNPKSYEAVYKGKDKDIIQKLVKAARKKKIE